MNFSREAATAGLCDWAGFADAPPNASSSVAMAHVARYAYATALIVRKEWGTGSYELPHAGRCAAAGTHYHMQTALLRGTTPMFGVKSHQFQHEIGAITCHLKGRLSDILLVRPANHSVSNFGPLLDAIRGLFLHRKRRFFKTRILPTEM